VQVVGSLILDKGFVFSGGVQGWLLCGQWYKLEGSSFFEDAKPYCNK
jgi:hypothetical protein